MTSFAIRAFHALVVSSLVLTIGGCTPNVEVSVQVLTDLTPVVEFDRVTLDRDGSEIVGRTVTATQRFDRPYVLAELTDVSPGSNVRLTVSLRRGGARVLARTIETRIDASRVLLFVLSSACQSVSCPPEDDPSATECADGLCVAPVCQGAACSPDAAIESLDAGSDEPDVRAAIDAPEALDAPLDDDAALPVDASSTDARSIDAPSIDARAIDARAIDAWSADAYAPPDAWGTCTGRPAGFLCRASRGICDPAETCDGLSAACPRDALALAGTVCRSRARGEPCDAIETCTGRSATCPLDVSERDGTSCDQFCGAETCLEGSCVGGVSCNPLTHACCSDRCMISPCRAE
ncbi:MAG: hypothetical protein J0L92_10145 [Deltaproteobacteria bacterium]|nr:hypothetical protein [Deltaproteobacteria bacterium]